MRQTPYHTSLQSQRCSTTPKTPMYEAQFVLVISENRCQEIGIAAFHETSYNVQISQFSDSSSYIHTLSLIYAWTPLEICILATLENSVLYERIKEEFEGVPLILVPRSKFDDTRGLQIYQASGTEYQFLEQDYASKYVSMSCLAALFSHIEETRGISFYMNTLHIKYLHLDTITLIDLPTIQNLEIALNKENLSNTKDTLCGCFQTHTRGGKRLLRSSLLQPSTDVDTITQRQLAVQELIGNQQLFYELSRIVPKFKDLELVIKKFKIKHNNTD